MGACQSAASVHGIAATPIIQEAVPADGTLMAEDAVLADLKTFVVPEASFSVPVRDARKFGWKKDLPDYRDRVLHIEAHSEVAGKALPSKVDLRPKETFEVYDQGKIGSCTANALAAAFHFEQLKQGIKDFSPSRLLIYYNERAMEGSIGDDAGAMIRDGIISLNKLGVCHEALWPYDVSKFAEKPSDEAYAAASNNKCQEYARVEQKLESLKACIAAGLPFVFGFTVFRDFYDPKVRKTGQMKFPPTGHMLGGHAVQACGYDDELKCFIVRNSWGADWGDKGHFYMPYDYITHPQLCEDFWAINFVTGREFPTRKHSMDVTPSLKYFSVPEHAFRIPVRSMKRFGWRPDLPSIHDRYFHAAAHSQVRGAILPEAVDLRTKEPFPVFDQGDLSSCTANAIGAAFQFEQLRQGLPCFTPSRLFIYYNERAMEYSVDQDAGAVLRDGIVSINKIGVCSEDMWPYDVAKVTTKPGSECYSAAVKNIAKDYARVEQTLDELKGCLAAGYPFIFGFSVYTDFYTLSKDFVMKYPPSGSLLGGHAVQACGYSDTLKCFIVRNSWGDRWGDKGHFYMPYEYITDANLAADFWAIKFVESAEFPTRSLREC